MTGETWRLLTTAETIPEAAVATDWANVLTPPLPAPLSSSPSREGCLQINNGQRHLIYLMLQTSFAKESNTKFPDLVPWDTKLGHIFSQIQVYPIKTYPSLMNKLYHTCLMIVLTCDVIVFVGRENLILRGGGGGYQGNDA